MYPLQPIDWGNDYVYTRIFSWCYMRSEFLIALCSGIESRQKGTTMNKTLLMASLTRAIRSFFQAIVAQIPAGFVITPAMLQYFQVGYVYVILAIFCNALLYAIVSFGTCIIGGLPEVEAGKVLGTGVQTIYDEYGVEDEQDEREV